MRLYTVNEVIEDIYQFESIRVRLELEPKESYFFKLYSEYYLVKTSGSATIEEFNAKLDRYIDHCSIGTVNQYPTGTHRFTIYSEDGNTLNRVAEYTSPEEELLTYNKISLSKGKILKYDCIKNEFSYFNNPIQKGE